MWHHYDCGCLFSQAHSNCTAAACLLVLTRILSLQTIPSTMAGYCFGPSSPLVLVMANFTTFFLSPTVPASGFTWSEFSPLAIMGILFRTHEFKCPMPDSVWFRLWYCTVSTLTCLTAVTLELKKRAKQLSCNRGSSYVNTLCLFSSLL